MNVELAFRIWFIAGYAIGFAVFVASIIRFRRRSPAVEDAVGPLPPPPALLSWLVPPVVMLIGVGELSTRWLLVRVAGVALSAYALIMMIWATRVRGRSYAPGPAILGGQRLVRSGPFRLVRHPIYSAVAALWLGAALGTLSWLLLVTWPFLAVGVTKQARAEEAMLRAKFGAEYQAYAAGRGGLVPDWRTLASSGS